MTATPRLRLTERLLRPMRPMRLLMATMVLSLLATMAQTASAQGHGGPGGRGMGAGAPQQMERMLDAVNATPEQRAQIKQITQAAQTDMRAQHEAGRKLREQSQALFAQPTVDARAAETLRQQMLAQHDQISKRRLQMMLDMSRVLSPEQRKTVADRMAQRRALMERHRAERDAIDKPASR